MKCGRGGRRRWKEKQKKREKSLIRKKETSGVRLVAEA
jgi:hypothetical protein